MPKDSNKLTQFWQELKRRKVIHVITVYAGAAFVIIELINNITDPLNLPDWTPTLIIVILLIGFPLAIIFSWIFDVTPEGIERTKPLAEQLVGEKPTISNLWKIATYVSVVIIAGLIVMNIAGGKKQIRIDKSLAKSIAVLPFQNYSSEPDQEEMCLGLTDEIINHLYRVESFDKVVSLTSVLKYRTPDKSVSEIAAELGVNYILEGVYKKIDDDLAVSAQLIEPVNDRHIWQQDYNRPYTDIMEIQSDIALQIADHINAFLSKEDLERIKKIPTTNQEAYEILQKYRIYWSTDPAMFFTTGLEQATRAIELDPAYADAYAFKGGMLLLRSLSSLVTFTQSDLFEAKRSIETALDLDNECALAHAFQGSFYNIKDWDYVKAESEYLLSLRLDRSNFVTGEGYFQFLHEMNRAEDAIGYSEEVADWWLGLALRSYVTAGRNEELVDILINRPGKYKNLPSYDVGMLYMWLGEVDSGLFWLGQAINENILSYTPIPYQSAYATALSLSGNAADGEEVIDKIKTSSQNTTTGGSPNFYVGAYYSWIGQKDSAFHWLEKAYNAREVDMPWLKVHPAFENLKEDPRYWDLYVRTGHKAYDDYMAGR